MLRYQKLQGDAFEVLYERHSAKVFSYILKRLNPKDKSKASDLAQEVFLKLHRSKMLYNQKYDFLPWLYVITKTVLLDDFKKNKNQKLVFTDYADIEAANEADGLNGLEIDIKTHIESLPELQRQAISLRYFDEKTFDEISEVLSVSPVNARQIISRGLKKMRELVLKKEGSLYEK